MRNIQEKLIAKVLPSEFVEIMNRPRFIYLFLPITKARKLKLFQTLVILPMGNEYKEYVTREKLEIVLTIYGFILTEKQSKDAVRVLIITERLNYITDVDRTALTVV